MTIAERATKLFDALEEAEGDQLCGLHFRPEREAMIADAIRAAVEEDRAARTSGLRYKCGCPAVPSEKVKAFCPEHLATLAE